MSKKNMSKYESGSCEIPSPDAPESEVWRYALSFKGYQWVFDKYKNCEFKNFVHPDQYKSLDNMIPGWENGEGEPSAVLLISFVGSGRDVKDVSIEELRAVLFFEQRGNRWHQDWPSESLEYARDLIEAIREKLTEQN